MFDNNKKLCKSLGIKVLPFIEIVAGSNLHMYPDCCLYELFCTISSSNGS